MEEKKETNATDNPVCYPEARVVAPEAVQMEANTTTAPPKECILQIEEYFGDATMVRAHNTNACTLTRYQPWSFFCDRRVLFCVCAVRIMFVVASNEII